ncbi:MAG: HDOD domain-containing protein [Oceanospirillaceae bacterium]|nr:HDOD domain-containing protein [Oceanospirillaceae bacterium]
MTAANSQVLLVRQPIFDHEQRVVGYELLGSGSATDLNLMQADDSGELILSVYTTLSEHGEEKRVPGFVSIPETMILADELPQLPARQVVMQVYSADATRPQLQEKLKSLVADGYRIALHVEKLTKSLVPLLDIVQIARVDVSTKSAEEIAKWVKALRQHKVAVMAVQIASMEQLGECIEAGCKLFEGSFLSKPKVVKGRKINANEVALMQLIQSLQKPNVKPEEIEQLVMRDPVLTYKLLRIVNSAAYSLVRKVESIAEAVVMLGMEQVKKWATLIAATSHQEKPEELSRALLIRGRMCELIAEGMKYPNPSGFFMAGMMSGFHLMLDITPEELMDQIPLGEDIQQAVRDRAGIMGSTITHAIAYESGDWDQLPADFDSALFESAYRQSLQWTKEAMLAMHES